MNNIFHTTKEVHRRYDLKGSSQGRTTKFPNNKVDPTVALKDNDIVHAGEHFIVTPENWEKLKNQIKKDVKFFRENNIIDYSLLIGIHDKNEDPKKGKKYCSKSSIITESDTVTITARDYSHPSFLPFYEREEGGITNFNKQKVYFLGVIDILTEYNTFKRFEHFIKKIRYGDKISCIPPEKYAARFNDFVGALFVTPSEYKDKIPSLNTPPPRREIEDIDKFERMQFLINDDMISVSYEEELSEEKKKSKKKKKDKKNKKKRIRNLDEEDEKENL